MGGGYRVEITEAKESGTSVQGCALPSNLLGLVLPNQLVCLAPSNGSVIVVRAHLHAVSQLVCLPIILRVHAWLPGMLCGLGWRCVRSKSNKVKQVNKWSRMLGDCKH